jgi:FixJ family two-component response regulator
MGRECQFETWNHPLELSGETGRFNIYVVVGDPRIGAEHAHVTLMLGHNVEVYSDVDQLLLGRPKPGVILVHQSGEDQSMGAIVRHLAERGIGWPVIVTAVEPAPEEIVAAIKAGALDYLGLPLEPEKLARSLDRVLVEAEERARDRLRLFEARTRVEGLTKREREVLERMAIGNSNKGIARELGISPRTVEIHRANMMIKIRANHATEAIRVWLQANLDSTAEAVDPPN